MRYYICDCTITKHCHSAKDTSSTEVLTMVALQQVMQDTYKVPVELQLLYHNRKKVEHVNLEYITLLQYGVRNEDLITFSNLQKTSGPFSNLQ